MNLCVTENAPTTEEDRKKIDAKKKRRGNYRRKGKKKSKEQKVRTALKTTPTLVWSGSSYGRVIREQLPIITLYYSSTAAQRQRTFSPEKKKTARSPFVPPALSDAVIASSFTTPRYKHDRSFSYAGTPKFRLHTHTHSGLQVAPKVSFSTSPLF